MFKNKIDIIKIQSILLYFFPLALISGPFFGDLFVVILGILFLFQSYITRNLSYLLYPISIYFWIWCLFLIISSIMSDNISLSFESSLFYFRFGLFTLAIWNVIEMNKAFLDRFSIAFIVTFIVILIDGYFKFFLSLNTSDSDYHYIRLTSLLGDRLILGSYLSRLLPFFFALIIYRFSGSKLYLISSFLILICTDLLIYLSGERTSFFLLLLSTILIISLVKKYKIYRLLAFTVSLLIILIFTLKYDSVNDRMIKSTIIETKILTENPVAFTEGHTAMFNTAFEIFKYNPIIGVGPKLYREACKNPLYNKNKDSINKAINTCNTHPHNTYFQLLSETGIIGILPLTFMLFLLIYLFFRQIVGGLISKKINVLTDYQVCLLVTLFVTLWPLAPSMNFFGNWVSAIYFLPAGFILHSFNNKDEDVIR